MSQRDFDRKRGGPGDDRRRSSTRAANPRQPRSSATSTSSAATTCSTCPFPLRSVTLGPPNEFRAGEHRSALGFIVMDDRFGKPGTSLPSRLDYKIARPRRLLHSRRTPAGLPGYGLDTFETGDSHGGRPGDPHPVAVCPGPHAIFSVKAMSNGSASTSRQAPERARQCKNGTTRGWPPSTSSGRTCGTATASSTDSRGQVSDAPRLR